MEKAKKKTIRKYIALAVAAALVLLLAVMPMLAQGDQAEEYAASILSGTVERGSIDTVLTGGGTLEAEDAIELTLPSGVMLTEFLVSNGDTVSEGEALAAVDRVSVMEAITQIQETLDYLAEEIEAAKDAEFSDTVTAQAGGKVKAVYAQEGDDVQAVMLEHGALAVLSLDGMMAVSLTTDAAVSLGDNVVVTLSDATQVTGRVESSLKGEVVVTLEDEGYAVGETVSIAMEDGTQLGSGTLYIHSQWNATAFSGTIDDVNISENQTVSAGKTLFTLSDVSDTAEYEQLSAQRREYEALMLKLFTLYQEQVLTAPCDGVVSGVDEGSTHLLSQGEETWSLELLVNAPTGDDTQSYQNYLGQVAAVGANGWALLLDPNSREISDYKDLSALDLEHAALSEIGSYAGDAPIYELVEGEWTQLEASDIAVGDLLIFAGDGEGSFVWVVRVQKAQTDTEQSGEAQQPEESTDPDQPTQPDGETETVDPTQTENAGQTVQPTMPTQSIQLPTGNTGFSTEGELTAEPEFELYGLEEDTVLSVTPQDTMQLSITVDELEVSKLSLGQSAVITVDALRGQSFDATVTAIATTGTNNGGNSKFTVELTMQRGTEMLAGMNATEELTQATTGDVLTIPVAALSDDGSRSVVYTDCAEGELRSPVEVTVGASDGETVEILSGLEEGATIYYAYYDTLLTSD